VATIICCIAFFIKGTIGSIYGSNNEILYSPLLKSVDSRGIPSRISGINWHGFDNDISTVLSGLKSQRYKFIIDQVKDLHFNSIRIPLSKNIFRKDVFITADDVDLKLNSELIGLNYLQCLDKIIDYCGEIGVGVILSRDSESFGSVSSDGSWDITSGYSHLNEQYLVEWVSLVTRYIHTAVIGVELWHSPKTISTADWNMAATRIGNAILDVNPYLLIIVERLSEEVWSPNKFRGNSLEPIALKVPNRLMYSVENLPADWYIPPDKATQTLKRRLRGVQTSTFESNEMAATTPIILMSMNTGHLPEHIVAFMNNKLDISTDKVNPNSKENPVVTGISWFIDAIDTTKLIEPNRFATLQTLFGPPLTPQAPMEQNSNSWNKVQLAPIGHTEKSAFHYYETAGNQIVDSLTRSSVRIGAVNWFGFDSSSFIAEGLMARNYHSILEQTRSLGFNTVRILWCNEMLLSRSQVTGVDFSLNPDLRALTPLQCLDRIVQYAGSIGLRIILARRSAQAGQADKETLWYIPGDEYYTSQRFVMDWMAMAKRYENSCVMAADLWDEPKTKAVGGEQSIGSSWAAERDFSDWNQAAEGAGNAILTASEQWLVVVQGIWDTAVGADRRFKSHGSDLSAVVRRPVALLAPHKVVYAVKECLCEGSECQHSHVSPFPSDSLRERWYSHWSYLVTDHIAPVIVTTLGPIRSDEEALAGWVHYLNGYYHNATINALHYDEQPLSWASWSLSTQSTDTHSSSGIFESNWNTVDMSLMSPIREAMAPRLL